MWHYSKIKTIKKNYHIITIDPIRNKRQAITILHNRYNTFIEEADIISISPSNIFMVFLQKAIDKLQSVCYNNAIKRKKGIDENHDD